jgi:hypothetical protein
VTFLRRGRDTGPTAVAPSPDALDSPAQLSQTLCQLNRFINRNAGRLPAAAVIAARAITDTLREIIDTSMLRELDVYAVLSVEATLNDYLPTTLRSYLAVDENLLNTPRRSGATPAVSLLTQLEALQAAACAVLVATHAQDADALVTQGNFLQTKFSASDLDL